MSASLQTLTVDGDNLVPPLQAAFVSGCSLGEDTFDVDWKIAMGTTVSPNNGESQPLRSFVQVEGLTLRGRPAMFNSNDQDNLEKLFYIKHKNIDLLFVLE